MRLIRYVVFLFFCFSLKAEEGFLMDDESESFLCEIVDQLKNALNYPVHIKIYISTDQSLNASATQDGSIVINAGAITQCANSKELIAILAHEIGHIQGAHIATYLADRKDFLKAGLVPALIGVIAGACAQSGAPIIAGMLGGQSLETGMALSKLRQKESIADTKSIQAVEKLGWWPVFDGFVSIHQKLSSNSAVFNKYLSTHPQSSERIAKFQKYKDVSSKSISQKTADLLQDYETRFQTIKMKIRALTISTGLFESFYKNPKNQNEKYARAIILYRLNKFQDAVKLIDQLLESSSSNPYYTEIKAMSLINLKRCSEAAGICWKILKSDRNTTVHRDLGIIYGDAVFEGKLTSHTKQAIKILKKILVKNEDDLSTLNLLGNLYTFSGEDCSAALYAAKSAYIFGDTKMAKIHAKKAVKSSNQIIQRQAQDIIDSIS